MAFQPERLFRRWAICVRAKSVKEAAILSTCNRTELYFATEQPQDAADWLPSITGCCPAGSVALLVHFSPARRGAPRVPGGQRARFDGHRRAADPRTGEGRSPPGRTGRNPRHHPAQALPAHLSVAKVRSTTAIGANTVSMAAAAVHLSERIFERVREQRVLFVGAGEMIERIAQPTSAASSPRKITIANRTATRAEALAARFGGDVLPSTGWVRRSSGYDIVVSGTGSPLPIIGLGMVERALKARRHRPMVMVDLAVPRDIEPEVARWATFSYTVDDLAKVVDSWPRIRQQAVVEAENIIDQRVDGFLHWLDSRGSVPTIRALRQHADTCGGPRLSAPVRLLARAKTRTRSSGPQPRPHQQAPSTPRPLPQRSRRRSARRLASSSCSACSISTRTTSPPGGSCTPRREPA